MRRLFNKRDPARARAPAAAADAPADPSKKNVLIMGNYQTGKTTIVCAFGGFGPDKAFVQDMYDESLYASKEVPAWKGSVALEGMPIPFGRSLGWRSREVKMQRANAYVVVVRHDDEVDSISYHFTRFEDAKKQNCPVLVLGRIEAGKPVPQAVIDAAKAKGARYMEFDPAKLRAKDASALKDLNDAIITLAFGSLAPKEVPVEEAQPVPVVEPISAPASPAKKEDAPWYSILRRLTDSAPPSPVAAAPAKMVDTAVPRVEVASVGS